MKDSNESLKIPDTLLRPKIGAPSTEEGSPGQGLQAEGVYLGFIGEATNFFWVCLKVMGIQPYDIWVSQ